MSPGNLKGLAYYSPAVQRPRPGFRQRLLAGVLPLQQQARGRRCGRQLRSPLLLLWRAPGCGSSSCLPKVTPGHGGATQFALYSRIPMQGSRVRPRRAPWVEGRDKVTAPSPTHKYCQVHGLLVSDRPGFQSCHLSHLSEVFEPQPSFVFKMGPEGARRLKAGTRQATTAITAD